MDRNIFSNDSNQLPENNNDKDWHTSSKKLSQLNFIMKTLKEMKESGEMCDLVFELGSTRFSIHRLVLAVWSPMMKNILQCHPSLTQYIQVSFDKPNVFEQFINYLYTGDISVHITTISTVLLLASTFQILHLRQQCEEYLKKNLTPDNVISLYQTAIKFQLPDLESQCISFLRLNLPEVAQKQGLRELSPAQINYFLGSEHVSKLDPEMKLFLIISWLTEDVAERQQFLVLLLKHIDWSVVAQDFLAEISQTDNFFTSNPSSLYLLLQTLHSSSIFLGPYEHQFESLREEYNYLLSSVVTSSVKLGSGKPQVFTPISFIFLSSNPLKKSGKSKDMSLHERKLKSKLKNDDKPDDDLDDCEDSIHDSRNEVNLSLSPSGNEQEFNKLNIPDENKEKVAKSKKPLPAFKRKKVIVKSGSLKSKQLKPCKMISESETKSKSGNKNVYTSKRVKLTKSSEIGKAVKKETLKTSSHKSLQEVATEMTLIKDVTIAAVTVEGSGHDIVKKVRDSKNVFVETDRQDKETLVTTSRYETRRSTKAGNSYTVKEAVSITTKRKDKKIGTPVVLTCTECQFQTNNKRKMEKHQQVHKGNCLFSCSQCSFKTKWNKEYNTHIKQVHIKGPPYKCDAEGCCFSSEKFPELVSHRKQHSDHRPFVCDICLTSFRFRNNLTTHLKIHSDEKKFECPECCRSFKLKNNLEQHMVTHSELRPYLCDLCGFSTKFQSHLISHKRIHTGEVYHCNFPSCSYSTPKRSQLQSHMRSHLGIRPHVCSTCGKAFVEKSHLIRHERIHSMDRTHSCSECKYASTRADKLKEHWQKHHSQEALKAKADLAAKKMESAGKGKQKRGSKTLSAALESDHENIIEVVVVKKDSGLNHKTLASEVTGMASSEDVSSVGHDMPGSHYQPAQAGQGHGTDPHHQGQGTDPHHQGHGTDPHHQGQGTDPHHQGHGTDPHHQGQGTDPHHQGHGTTPHQMAVSMGDHSQGCATKEKELSSVEILARMGLILTDVSSAGDPVFGGYSGNFGMRAGHDTMNDGHGLVSQSADMMPAIQTCDGHYDQRGQSQRLNNHYEHASQQLSNHLPHTNPAPKSALGYSSGTFDHTMHQPMTSVDHQMYSMTQHHGLQPNLNPDEVSHYIMSQPKMEVHQQSSSNYSNMGDYLY